MTAPTFEILEDTSSDIPFHYIALESRESTSKLQPLLTKSGCAGTCLGGMRQREYGLPAGIYARDRAVLKCGRQGGPSRVRFAVRVHCRSGLPHPSLAAMVV